MKKKENKSIWKFWEIKTKEESKSWVKQASYGFFFIAGLEIILGGFLFGLSAIIDGVTYGVLGLLLFLLKSRIVAIILAVLSTITFVFTFLGFFGFMSGAGTNIFLASYIVYIAVGAVYATFKYHKRV